MPLALSNLQSILESLTPDERLSGVENPVRIYLICYHILQANNPSARAWEVLRGDYNLLPKRVAQIVDSDLR